MPCQGPKDIPDTVAQASAAAGQAMSLASRGELQVESATCWVEEDRCSGCRVCNSLCPMTAISFHEEKKRSEINEALCKGCGTCAAACPSAAIVARHFTDEQVLSEIEGVLYDGPHEFNAAMQDKAYAWLERWLKPEKPRGVKKLGRSANRGWASAQRG